MIWGGLARWWAEEERLAICDPFQDLFVNLLELESLPPPKEGTILEHVEGVRVEGPVGSLSWAVGSAGDFDKTVVEGKVVPEGVLPSLRVFPEKMIKEGKDEYQPVEIETAIKKF